MLNKHTQPPKWDAASNKKKQRTSLDLLMKIIGSPTYRTQTKVHFQAIIATEYRHLKWREEDRSNKLITRKILRICINCHQGKVWTTLNLISKVQTRSAKKRHLTKAPSQVHTTHPTWDKPGRIPQPPRILIKLCFSKTVIHPSNVLLWLVKEDLKILRNLLFLKVGKEVSISIWYLLNQCTPFKC